jgi:hypothetical protein
MRFCLAAASVDTGGWPTLPDRGLKVVFDRRVDEPASKPARFKNRRVRRKPAFVTVM